MRLLCAASADYAPEIKLHKRLRHLVRVKRDGGAAIGLGDKQSDEEQSEDEDEEEEEGGPDDAETKKKKKKQQQKKKKKKKKKNLVRKDETAASSVQEHAREKQAAWVRDRRLKAARESGRVEDELLIGAMISDADYDAAVQAENEALINGLSGLAAGLSDDAGVILIPEGALCAPADRLASLHEARARWLRRALRDLDLQVGPRGGVSVTDHRLTTAWEPVQSTSTCRSVDGG